MLSRTADSLFWLSRYVERAENMSRLVDMGRRIASIPNEAGGFRDDWPSVLAAAGCAADGDRDGVAGPQAMRRLLLDRSNPSSVASCLDYARSNARAARAALTKEMWESVNEAWISIRSVENQHLSNGALSPLLEWIKQVGAHFRGATDSSSLRWDGYDFLRLGVYVERLDSGARLMDVASISQSGARGGREVGSAVDEFHWVSALRACGVLRGYHAACRGEHDGRSIAHFLMTDARCPRSLLYCAREIVRHLQAIEAHYGRRGACQDEADALEAMLATASIDDAFDGDLHGFLSAVIRANNAVSLSIAETFHFAPKRDVSDPTPVSAEHGDDEPAESLSPLARAEPMRRRSVAVRMAAEQSGGAAAAS